MQELKLFMLLLGCKPPGRHVEQHDIFFGVAETLKDLVPEIRAFWRQPTPIHIDAWREVKQVDGFDVRIVPRESPVSDVEDKLFFINLGGYQENQFDEQHYVVLTVKKNKTNAIQEAKKTFFFKNNHFADANSHIDDKYGIDVDDFYEIEEMLSPGQKEKFRIKLRPAAVSETDVIQLGYFKLSAL